MIIKGNASSWDLRRERCYSNASAGCSARRCEAHSARGAASEVRLLTIVGRLRLLLIQWGGILWLRK